MNERRLEEIFEECVTAYLEGRRSIPESLQLYPAFAPQLAPLLQTAVQLNESFSKVDAPAHVRERIRHRFLADARARRHIRALRRHGSVGLFSGFWQRQRFGFAAASGALAVLVLAVGSAAMLIGGGTAEGPGGSAGNFHTPASSARPTPESVQAIRSKIDDITARLSNKTVTSQDLSDLQDASVALNSQDVEDAPAEVQKALQDADALVSDIVEQQPELAQPAAAAQDTLRDVASNLDVDLNATPAATTTPVATGEAPTAEPTQQATEQPTEAPTAEPTAVPTDTPVPTPTPIRGLPGENP
jgi:hypothetical protein